ncbi:hypothetical protein [Aureimonas fodinaquatilis]|uniref:hypothetical protein n=1 Tax=Aureimonas fodinaquatilis TaxID=2565783 RepID=UPI001FEACCE2|nr:hypothetical protein [Aureimonas fodinaquatilis]
MRWSKKLDEVKSAAGEKGAAVVQAARDASHGNFEKARNSLHDGGIAWPDALRETRSLGAAHVGALALGACAIGALAIGAFAIGRLSVGKAYVGDARIDRLNIGRLEVEHFTPPRLSSYLTRRH